MPTHFQRRHLRGRVPLWGLGRTRVKRPAPFTPFLRGSARRLRVRGAPTSQHCSLGTPGGEFGRVSLSYGLCAPVSCHRGVYVYFSDKGQGSCFPHAQEPTQTRVSPCGAMASISNF